MSDKKVELNRRRVLGGVLTVGAAAAAAGAGTMAYFSDTATSNDNNIVTGTLTLDGVSDGVITVTELAPGESFSGSVQTTYDSSSSINPAEGDFSVSISDPGSEPTEPSNSSEMTASELAQQLNVTTAELQRNGSQETDLTTAPQGVANVDDLAGISIDDGFGSVAPGDNLSFQLEATMDTGAGNDYQADGVSLSVTFTAEQPGAD